MKKITLLFVALMFTVIANAQVLSAHAGYSWLNGVVGLEYNVSGFGISAGVFPAKLPATGGRVASFSGALSFYGKDYDESGWYASIGIASAGYREQTSYGGSSWSTNIQPMTIVMVGSRGSSLGTWAKLGAGAGFSPDGGAIFTFELLIGFQLLGYY